MDTGRKNSYHCGFYKTSNESERYFQEVQLLYRISVILRYFNANLLLLNVLIINYIFILVLIEKYYILI